MTTRGQNRPGKELALQNERAVNHQYLERLAKLAAAPAVCDARNDWTESARRSAPNRTAISPLVGCVALREPDPDLGTRFYVGRSSQDWDGAMVVSWVAPMAKAFYEGRAAASDTPAGTLPLAGRRTFVTSSEDILDFSDDLEPGVESIDDATEASTLAVSAAPRRAKRHLPEPRPGPVRQRSKPEDQDPVASQREQTLSPSNDGIELRAREVVLDAITRPRQGRLLSMLGTLQPDQYDLVTLSHDALLIVQGKPGTGKTVVAVHRAAMLTHPEQPHALRSVLLIGPSERWTSHVLGAVRELAADRVQVLSLSTLTKSLAYTEHEPPPRHRDRTSTSFELGRAVDVAIDVLRSRSELSADPTTARKQVLRGLCEDAQLRLQAAGGDADLMKWLLGLGTPGQVGGDSEYVLLLASIAARLSQAPQYDHVIVDEAQDVRPLEWLIVKHLLRPGASMSLFGDVNQRQSDDSPASWTKLAIDLELGGRDQPPRPHVMDISYRSTRQIMTFANRLLPRRVRKVRALVEGPDVQVAKVSRSAVATSTVAQAAKLCARYQQGLVAVIAPDLVGTRRALIEQGWRRGRDDSWSRAKHRLDLLTPDQVRGLEFDGVVVSEPADFPANVGRQGPLYTSLTRATRELIVVHSRKMPRGLRAR